MTPDELIADRAPSHGDYADVARLAQILKMTMYSQEAPKLSAVHRESLDLIATKIARICCGDPNHRDHWDDIAGYAKLAADRIAVPPASPCPPPMFGGPGPL